MTEYNAGRLSDLKENEPIEAKIGDTPILLVRQGGKVHALAAICPHRGVPLKNGAIDGGRIVCGAHRGSFELETGAVIAPPACESLARYDTRLDGDRVMVTLPDGGPEHPLPQAARQGHDPRHFVVVGSGAAGWRAAEMLRREGFEGRLTVVTDEGPAPLDRPAFSKSYLAPEDPPDTPYVRAPSDICAFDIAVREATVTRLDPVAKALSLEDEAEPLRYDRLLVATGCAARSFDLPGADRDGIHRIRTKADADALRADVARQRRGGTCRLAIVGGGFIGLEAAASLGGWDGVEVTLILRGEKPFRRLFGDAFGDRVLAENREAGVTVVTGAEVAGFSGEERVTGIRLESGEVVPCDAVLIAVGAAPRTGWLPFEAGDDGGIEVEADLSVPGAPDVFLAGDIARLPTPWGKVRIEHWRFAQETGELAARNMLGQDRRYEGTPFFWTMQQATGSYTYTGHAKDWDEIRGTPAGSKFAMAFTKDARAHALLALGFDDRVTLTERRMAATGPVAEEDIPVYDQG